MNLTATRDEFTELVSYLKYTLHELPLGILFGHDGATQEQCAVLMRMTYRLEELAKERGAEVTELIAKCRWHYERYPHYLGRRRHFGTYAAYMEKHCAPSSDGPNTSLERKPGS